MNSRDLISQWRQRIARADGADRRAIFAASEPASRALDESGTSADGVDGGCASARLRDHGSGL